MSDITVYILGIVGNGDGIAPGVFEEDLYESPDGGCRITGFQDMGFFIEAFLDRKKRFLDNFYADDCIGLYHYISDANKHGDWPYAKDVPMKIILKRR